MVNSDGPIGCAECGALNQEATALVARLRADLHHAEVELRAKRARISELRSEQTAAAANDQTANAARAVLEEWRRTCSPKARELDGKRLVLAVARLNAGYSQADLMQAVHGYACRPYVVNGRRLATGTPSQRFVDATLIFRDAQHVDAGIAIATEEDQNFAQRGDRTQTGQLAWMLGLKG